MCKLLMMTSITEPKLAVDFMTRMAVLMSKRNDDGIGYTAVRSDGSMFTQRWKKNNQFLSTKEVMTANVAKKLASYAPRLPSGALVPNYAQSGNIDFSDMRTLTLHTRYATCGQEFANTHPFVDKDISLIHNGGISNYKELAVNKISTCDSEAALQTFISNDINKSPADAQKWLDMLQGRWAFGVLSLDAKNRRVLDVVRGFSQLFYMEAAGLGRIFTTDDDDAKNVLKEMNLEFTVKPSLIENNSMFRYDAVTGDFLEEIKIKDSVKNYVAPTPLRTTIDIMYGGGSSLGKWTGGKFVLYTEMEENEALLNAGNGYKVTSPAEVDPSDFYEHDGSYNLRNCNKYCNDWREELEDRITLWDMVYSTKYYVYYSELTKLAQDHIENVDYMQGFTDARKEILRLTKQLRDSKKAI